MRLTGVPLQITVVVVALAAIVATVRLAPRVSGGRAMDVLARLGLILGCQLCVVLAVLDVANASFDFYGSWGDLVGVRAKTRNLAVPPANASAANRSALVTPDPTAPRYRLPAGQGRIDSVVIHGTRTLINERAFVYLPQQYFAASDRTRFPVLVAFTGYPGDAQNLITHLGLPRTVAQEVAAGRMPPTIVVMLRSTVAPPRDTECTDIPHGPQAETFFAQDVPVALASAYRTADRAAGWGAMGDSTGGYCAAKLVMRNSDRYSAGISLAGYYHALQDFTTGDLYGRSKAYRDENDLLWRLRHLPSPPVSILLTTSRVGEKDYAQTRRFLALTRPPMRVASITLPFGGHHFSTWRRELPPALQWLGARLAGGTPTGSFTGRPTGPGTSGAPGPGGRSLSVGRR
ncbi:alpha/beta hydrolase [Actinoallomurus iriomotensis]|uniref:Esterase n=1 Tax=Actinoallomurus iriomotensis TaxID=478107 RepID=A0A9W6RKK1_9ACTN|nr:alpha/beta hydrolase-fold protein [Actinoallomurus iriomotensis]GLY75707.1 esterase [Actinoallomurus iriomotensis]